MNVAVITGAASGIGLALTQVHLHHGNKVVMVDRDATKLTHQTAQLSKEYPEKILAVNCDVTNADEVAQLVQQTLDHFGQVDWIYNNAGIIGQLAPVWTLKPESIDQVMNVNVLGMVHVIQAFMPHLLNQSTPAHIINIASLYALCASAQTAAYSMSKHAVLALSESLHFDLLPLQKPISVSVVFPSFTDTGLLTPTEENNSTFHHSLHSMLAHSRPAMEIAQHIVEEVAQKKFYIFPDKEVKGYCEERTNALVLQESPHSTSVEKLISALTKRRRG